MVYPYWKFLGRGTRARAPFEFVSLKGRHLLISLHLRGDFLWYRFIWGELFSVEGFFNRIYGPYQWVTNEGFWIHGPYQQGSPVKTSGHIYPVFPQKWGKTGKYREKLGKYPKRGKNCLNSINPFLLPSAQTPHLSLHITLIFSTLHKHIYQFYYD